MKVDRINWINVVLMTGAAIAAPFHTFLFAYAILGPLHYLTVIGVTSAVCSFLLSAVLLQDVAHTGIGTLSGRADQLAGPGRPATQRLADLRERSQRHR